MTRNGDPHTEDDKAQASSRRRNPFDVEDDIPVQDRMRLRPNWLFILAIIGCLAFWAGVVAVVLRFIK